jgi:hypothetical protein
MAEIKSESVADFIPESAADFAQNTHLYEISHHSLGGDPIRDSACAPV